MAEERDDGFRVSGEDAEKPIDLLESAADLRRRAEEMLPFRAQDLTLLNETDIMVLIHELQVHQVELEMQNEELRHAQLKLQDAAERFSSLYDFSPVGYLALDDEGAIVEANLTLVRQLGIEHRNLVSNLLSRHVHRDDQSEYHLFRRRLTGAKETESVEVRLRMAGGEWFWAHLEGRPWPDGEAGRVWRVAISDVTERRTATEFLKQLTDELERRVDERTSRLNETNRQLLDEVRQRRQVELLLRDREELLEQRVEERTRTLASLLEISHSVVSTLHLQQVVSLILEHLRSAVGYTGCAVYLLEGETLKMLDYRGPLPREEALRLRLSLGSVAGIPEVIAGRRPVIIDDLAADSDPARAWRAQAAQEQMTLLGKARSWMAVPLLAKDRAIGALRLDHEQPGYFTEQHARLALAIANHAAVAVENARLYQQAQQLATMEERQRLARELHDSVAQTFYSIALAAHTLKNGQGTRDTKAKTVVEHIIGLCDAGLAEARAVIFALRPETIEREGLVAALERQMVAFRARGDIEFATVLGEEPDAPVEVKEALYRIAQEALRNVMRHASAKQSTVQLRMRDGQLELEVTDDGAGFDVEKEYAGLGLRSMRERVNALHGTLEVTSSPERGARVLARLPMGQEG